MRDSERADYRRGPKHLHAADLESERLKRGMTFDPIDWSDQAEQPMKG